jgi:hypothetical protein
MPAQTPEKVLETIKCWIVETGKFELTQENDPKTFFSFWIIPKVEERGTKRIFVTYPRQFSQSNMIIVGWGWELLETDQNAYSAVKEIKLKENLLGAIKHECYSRGLILSVLPDEVNLKVIKISRLMPLETISEPKFINAIFELWYMWAFLMRQFEKNNMSRAGSDPLHP